MHGFDIDLSTDNFNDYVVEQEGGGVGLGLPSLQMLTYQPRTLSEKVPFCLDGRSISLMNEEQLPLLGLLATKTNYGEDDVEVFVINEPVRWVVLGKPEIFLFNKKTKEIIRRAYPWPEGFRTATRVLLLCLVKDKFLLSKEGEPQMFTLKLTSTKTNLIEGTKDDKSGTIVGLNQALLKRAKMEGKRVSLVHTVSVSIDVMVKKLTSAVTGESSNGVLYQLSQARELPPDLKKVSSEIARSVLVQEVLKDPFLLERRSSTPDESGDILKHFWKTISEMGLNAAQGAKVLEQVGANSRTLTADQYAQAMEIIGGVVEF